MTDVTDARVDAPRDDLIRMTTTLRHEGDGNMLVGYAAVFDDETEIDSWEGRFIERIAPGAFRKTLRERGAQVKVLFNHGMDPQIGDKPLGKPSVMKEDDRGLYVEVPLDDTSYNRDIKALLASGALDGMSFRMNVVRDDWDFPEKKTALPVRTIQEIKLYEFGPVTFPAYAATQAGVRAHAPKAFEAYRNANNLPPTHLTPPSAEDDREPDDPSTRSDTPPETTETVTAPPPPIEEPAPPATPEDAPPNAGHPSQRRSRLTAERRALTLASIRESLDTERERSSTYGRLVEQYEAATERPTT